MEIKTLKELSINGCGKYGIAAPAVEKNDQLYNYLRITDINDDGTINYKGLKSVNAKGAEKFILKKNDIVFARTGASTGRNFFCDGTDKNLVYAGFLIKFSIDSKKVNPKFIKYYCLSTKFKNWVNSFNSGSTRGNINAQTFGNMKVELPPRIVQDNIVNIMDALDEKIKVNRKINDNLYAQVKAIFDNYFINIDTIPVTWKKGNLLDIASYLNGLAMQRFRHKDGEIAIPVMKIKELRQGFCDESSELCSPSIKSDYIIKDGDIIFSWSGSLLVDIWCGGKCGLNQHLFKVTSSNYDKWFFYLWTSYHLDRFIAIARDKATTMGHIKRGDLGKAHVIIPSQDDYKKINAIMNPLFEHIIVNRIENRKLAELRNSLLSKLMSGEINISEV